MKINRRLEALIVPAEKIELEVIGTYRARRIKFAFFQSDFKGGKLPYWHVNWKGPNEFGTTLSMEGLKQWGYL